ncbi:MAG: PRC-barrel domain-containing protein [Pseudomonadota bacterium]
MKNAAQNKNRNSIFNKMSLDGGFIALLAGEVVVAIAILLAGVFGNTAQAAEYNTQLPIVLAYSDTSFGERHGDPFGDVFLDEHELNDAWMGMDVQTIDGKKAGYITDAILDENGVIDVVIVTPTEDSELRQAIVVGANFVILEAAHVTVDMTLNTLAAQQNADEFFETALLD